MITQRDYHYRVQLYGSQDRNDLPLMVTSVRNFLLLEEGDSR